MFRLWALECGRHLVCGIDGVSEALVIWTNAINRATFVILWNHRFIFPTFFIKGGGTRDGKIRVRRLILSVSVKAKWFCATLYCLFSQVKLVLITKYIICIIVNALRLLYTSVMSCMVLVCAGWWDLSPAACLLNKSSGWMKASSINTKIRILHRITHFRFNGWLSAHHIMILWCNLQFDVEKKLWCTQTDSGIVEP